MGNFTGLPPLTPAGPAVYVLHSGERTTPPEKRAGGGRREEESRGGRRGSRALLRPLGWESCAHMTRYAMPRICVLQPTPRSPPHSHRVFPPPRGRGCAGKEMERWPVSWGGSEGAGSSGGRMGRCCSGCEKQTAGARAGPRGQGAGSGGVQQVPGCGLLPSTSWFQLITAPWADLGLETSRVSGGRTASTGVGYARVPAHWPVVRVPLPVPPVYFPLG